MGKIIDKTLILNRVKTANNLSGNSELARFLGVAPNTVTNWYNRNSIDYDIVFSKCVNINPEWLLTGSGEMLKSTAQAHTAVKIKDNDTKAVYLYDVSASGGFGSFDEMISRDKVIGKYVVPDFHSVDWLIYVKGSSMYPKYSSGDIIACREIHESRFIQWGKVYVIGTREQGILVKRLKKSDKEDCITALSDNPSYDPFDIPKDEIFGIALVVGVIRLE